MLKYIPGMTSLLAMFTSNSAAKARSMGVAVVANSADGHSELLAVDREQHGRDLQSAIGASRLALSRRSLLSEGRGETPPHPIPDW